MTTGSPLLQRTTHARIPNNYGSFQLYHYLDNRDRKEHLALVLGAVAGMDDVVVRVHSECMTGDTFGSLRCDCGEQLHAAMQRIAEEGRGVILYLRQEGRGIGLAQKLRAYNLQDEGYDTVDANLLLGHQADERDYWAAAAILADLEIRSIRLLTNNPAKIEHLRELGITISERLPLQPSVHAQNRDYLHTKVARMRHLLQLPDAAPAVVSGARLPAELAQLVATVRERSLDHFALTGRPFVTLTYAQSLDGSIAAAPGRPLALSGPVSSTLTHALRAAHDAILVGIGTVLADDPRLTVRLVAGPNPQPVVLDSHLRLPPTARLRHHPRGVWLATTAAAGGGDELAQSATLLSLPAGDDGRVDLAALVAELGRRGVRSVMVEGGQRVLSSFLAQRLADTLVVTLTPQVGGGLPAFDLSPGAGERQEPVRLHRIAYLPAGDDLVVAGDPA
jgi:3,4-dihydroxy 2-butanone 4-phosphate synthase/GTP cyclohydrolase II